MAAAIATATETARATEMVMVTAIIKMPTTTLTTAHRGQQQGQHARDVPCGGCSGGNVGGGMGECNSNSRGDGNGGSGRGGQ